MPNETRVLSAEEIEALAASGALDGATAAGLLRHNARDAALEVEEKARSRTLPPPAAEGDTRSPAERTADAVAKHVAERKFRAVPATPAFVPRSAAPALTSPAIAAAQQLIADLEARRVEDRKKLFDLQQSGAELRRLKRSGTSQTAAARAKQNKNDRIDLEDEIADLADDIARAQAQLATTVAEAEAEHRDSLIGEAQGLAAEAVAAAEDIDKALAGLNTAADKYLRVAREIGSSTYRGLGFHVPGFELLVSETRLGFAVAYAGDAAKRLLGTDYVSSAKRASFAEMARHSLASVIAALLREKKS